jgi:HlyD family secretion protein
MSKKSLRLIIIAAVVGVGGFFGYQYWQQMKAALPKGIASGNGRIEAKLVDITPKEALRVKEIRVEEGALVRPGEVLVVMDTTTLESQLAEAKLNVGATQEKQAVAKATIERSRLRSNLPGLSLIRKRGCSMSKTDWLSSVHQLRHI